MSWDIRRHFGSCGFLDRDWIVNGQIAATKNRMGHAHTPGFRVGDSIGLYLLGALFLEICEGVHYLPERVDDV